VISLARRPDRRERFLRWNAGKGIDISVFDAIDGRSLSKRDLVAAGIVQDDTLGFSAGALGNAMSHRALWELCIKLDRPILIFEDDAFVPSTFREWIEPIVSELAVGSDIFFAGYNRDAILSIGYGGQWCNLAFEPNPLPFETLMAQQDRGAARNSRCIVDARVVWGTLGYAIAPAGAQALLRHCFPLSDKIPVRMYGSGRLLTPYALDGVINAVIQQGLVRARTIYPPLIIGPNEQADSDVAGNLRRPANG
jgi:glycosyl transferase, family 25